MIRGIYLPLVLPLCSSHDPRTEVQQLSCDIGHGYGHISFIHRRYVFNIVTIKNTNLYRFSFYLEEYRRICMLWPLSRQTDEVEGPKHIDHMKYINEMA